MVAPQAKFCKYSKPFEKAQNSQAPAASLNKLKPIPRTYLLWIMTDNLRDHSGGEVGEDGEGRGGEE